MDFFTQIRKTALILFFLIGCQFLSAQSVDFFREYIEIEIEPPLCNVMGFYYFKNNASMPVDRTIYYPFVVTKFISYPCDITITNMNDSTNISFVKTDSAALFRLHLEPRSITQVKVVFSQKTKAQQFEYILTTTRKWGKSLDQAEYRVTHPASIEVNMHPSGLFKKTFLNGKISHYIQHKNFMPRSNLIINWSEIK